MVWWYNEWASGMDWDVGGKQVGMKKIWIWRIVYIILSVASVGLFIYCVSSRDLKRLLPSIICVILSIKRFATIWRKKDVQSQNAVSVSYF